MGTNRTMVVVGLARRNPSAESLKGLGREEAGQVNGPEMKKYQIRWARQGVAGHV